MSEEPDLSRGEQALQVAVAAEVRRILDESGRLYLLVEELGLDLAVWIQTGATVAIRSIELKVFLGARRGGVGFGNQKGQGPQVDLLMSDANLLELLDDTTRWIIGNGTVPPGAARFAIVSSILAKAAAMGGVARGKQNNLRIRDFRDYYLDWPHLCAKLREFLLPSDETLFPDYPPARAIPAGARVDIEFTHDQLVSPDYNPIQRGDVDLEDLARRYPRYTDLHHAAAVRGILVRDEDSREWRWIWGIGLLHDEILKASGYPRLFARYRNQYRMAARIEFEPGADIPAALELLLRTTPIQRHDLINIETPLRRAGSIDEYLGG